MAFCLTLTLQDIGKMKALFRPQSIARLAVRDPKISTAEIPANYQIEIQDRSLQERAMNLCIA